MGRDTVQSFSLSKSWNTEVYVHGRVLELSSDQVMVFWSYLGPQSDDSWSIGKLTQKAMFIEEVVQPLSMRNNSWSDAKCTELNTRLGNTWVVVAYSLVAYCSLISANCSATCFAFTLLSSSTPNKNFGCTWSGNLLEKKKDFRSYPKTTFWLS